MYRINWPRPCYGRFGNAELKLTAEPADKFYRSVRQLYRLTFQGFAGSTVFEASVSGLPQTISVTVPPLGAGVVITSVLFPAVPVGSSNSEVTFQGSNLDRVLGISAFANVKATITSRTPTEIKARFDVPSNELIGMRSVFVQTCSQRRAASLSRRLPASRPTLFAR
jgi:hypothetical protein